MAWPANNNTNINNETFSPLVAAAQFAAYENSVARAIVTNYDVPANSGKIVQVPVWSAIAATNITDEAAATALQTNTTAANITLTEHVVYNQVTDMLQMSAESNVLSDLGTQSGRAIAESMDSEVFSLFTNFTASQGSAGAEVTVDTILKAVATLRVAKLTGPFYCVLHPAVAYNIKKQLTYAQQTNIPALSGVGEGVLGQFGIGQIAGCTIMESALISVDAQDDAIGAVFSPSAIGHAMRGSVSVATQYQAAARATDLVLTGVAGASILQNNHGVKILGDAIIN